jgi:hypothetical protein
MVRILKVKELQDKKRELLARSELYRQTLTLEVTNVKLGWALLKKRMRVLKTVYRMVGWAVPISAVLFGQKKKERRRRGGFLSQLLSGFNLAAKIKSMFGGGRAHEHEAAEVEETPRV